MTKKFCRTCQTEKTLEDFNKHRRMKDGRASQCRECTKKAGAKYRKENPELIAKGRTKWYQENKEHCHEQSRQWAKNNPDRRKEIVNLSYQNNREAKLEYSTWCRNNNKDKYKVWVKEWAERNRDRERAKYARRRTARLNAQPAWLTEEHHKEILNFYSLARDCELVTGEKYHVDHIVPLQGKNVCGLHAPWNLQVLPSDVNQSKSNKYDEETSIYCG